MSMGEIQDEFPGAPERPNADRGLLIGLILGGTLLMAVIGGVVISQWPDADDRAATSDGELEIFANSDLAVVLEDDFAIDADGELSAEAQAMIADLESRSGVDRVVYVGPATVAGIVPDAPTLEAFGHELLVFGDDGIGFTAAQGQIINEFSERPGVDFVAVPE